MNSLPVYIRVTDLDSVVGHVLNTNCASWHDFVVYFHSLIYPSWARSARPADEERQVRQWNGASMQISQTTQSLIGSQRAA